MKKIVCLLALLSAGSAQANLITNGDFSTDNISGWSLSGGDYSQVESGVFREFDNSGWAILSQNIATVVGLTYNISFDTFASQIISGNDFAWAADGILTSIPTTTTWATNTDTFVATGSSTNIAFHIATDEGTGTWRLDNISVTAATSVPEPASLALLGIGLAGLGAMRLRKQA